MLIDLQRMIGNYLFDVFVTNFDWWVILGFVAQLMFTGRFLVQLIASDEFPTKETVSPMICVQLVLVPAKVSARA